ncbi:beta-lactamase/transpeptidase-like protein [Polyplosphaeria fusca]|uniref:Beta-lactamase/transpeptidase-like protein n=1 Tax=Polyplosphaeria fusca TaxID=682080 RepID=A0A9P4QYE1_9PLEO|nr:beta-lactamase/transpeptidase-like protein [Polyplosphaeria fusca]
MPSILTWASLLIPLLSHTQAQVHPSDDCPILGPSFPSDFDISQSKSIQQAIETFPSLIDALFEAGALNSSSSSFHIDVFSTRTNASIYSYSHSGEVLKDTLTAGTLDDGTIFRIGSVSKLFTVYALLNIAGIDIFDHPVTEYLPELKGNAAGNRIKWEEVTVGALAEQQGGSGGFPLEDALCTLTGNCANEAFLQRMRDVKRPVVPVFQTAMYSDAGFGVLGRVIERLTNQSYADALQTHLAVPLGLKSVSTFEPPADGLNALAIPGGDLVSSWGTDNQITASSGGIYANTHDLRELGLSILQNRLLCADVTREWMKPRSHTSSLTMSVGAPWEIYRLTIPTSAKSNRTRVSDLYTKMGGQVAYAGIFALSPDHDLGYSVLVAGENATQDRIPLRDVVGTAFIPAAEAAAFENAASNYGGVFADPNNESSNLTLTVDDDKPGLGLPALFVDGVDWRANITQPAFDVSGDLFSYRLYPSGTEYVSPATGALVKLFNAVWGIAKPMPRTLVDGGEGGLFEDACMSWTETGFYTTSDFELEVVGGRLERVRMMDSNVTMARVG